MIEVALFCTVTAPPVRRTSSTGKPWLSVGVRTGYGEVAQWAWLAVFGDDVAALADLSAGARLYAEGNLTVSIYEKAGEQRPSINIACSYCRLAQIGRAKPKAAAGKRHPRSQHEAPINDRPAFDDDLPI